jgi:hypothetical protein
LAIGFPLQIDGRHRTPCTACGSVAHIVTKREAIPRARILTFGLLANLTRHSNATPAALPSSSYRGKTSHTPFGIVVLVLVFNVIILMSPAGKCSTSHETTAAATSDGGGG